MLGKSEDRNLDKQNFDTNYLLLSSPIVCPNSHDQVHRENFKFMVLSSKQAPPVSFFWLFFQYPDISFRKLYNQAYSHYFSKLFHSKNGKAQQLTPIRVDYHSVSASLPDFKSLKNEYSVESL